MIATLVEPVSGHTWSLQFQGVPIECKELPDDIGYNETKANIWYWCRHFGEHWKTGPFLQGNSGDWMMIEFLGTGSESLILECCLHICKQLNVELDIDMGIRYKCPV